MGRGGLLIVGNRGGTNVGESFLRAGNRLGFATGIIEPAMAMQAPRIVRAVCWHLLGRKAPNATGFNGALREQMRRQRPEAIVVAGMAPIEADTLRFGRELGAAMAVFVTDDPWSPVHKAKRFLATVPEYDLVLTPRRLTIPEFESAGARRVEYMAFGYDRDLWFNPAQVKHGTGADVLFVGGGDCERAELLAPLLASSTGVTIYGSFWPRGTAAARVCQGQAGVETLRTATKAAKVNICLVRRSNRDEHVMRSYEAAAAGGCIVAEDTEDHRRIFADGARYFRTAEDLLEVVDSLLPDEPGRMALAEKSESRVTATKNTYDDRLKEIMRLLGREPNGEQRA